MLERNRAKAAVIFMDSMKTIDAATTYLLRGRKGRVRREKNALSEKTGGKEEKGQEIKRKGMDFMAEMQ